DELIIFNNISKIDKEKLSFITEDDRRFAWHYITLFYNEKPCSLNGFKLYDDDGCEYSRIKNNNGTKSFLFKTKLNLYFKDDLIYKICYNEYKLTDFCKNGKIYIYLTLNNYILNLSDFKYKFINEEVYQTIDIDKSKLDIAFFDNRKFEEIKVEHDGVRDYYKLKDEIEEDNISEKIFIKS
ncbi:13387_t:CDS:2, partial [Dentiscutata erythropus]